MPWSSGTHDAIAVPTTVGHELTSAYTFLLDHIVLLVWSLIVISGLLVYITIHKARHPHDPLSRALWAKRASPYSILKLTVKHLWRSKNREWWILLWLFLALGFLVMKYTIPILFAHYIIIDNAAPVAAQAIFVPSYNGELANANDAKQLLDIFALELPAAFRAVGNIDSVNSTIYPTSLITVDQPEILPPNSSTGDPNQRINYNYVVTGQDFGLQNYPDLILNVEGSCVTEYSWYSFTGSPPGDPGLTGDFYELYGNKSQLQFAADDSHYPYAQFFVSTESSGPASNRTWAALISSANRLSYWSSNDPWYSTVQFTPNNAQAANYAVKTGRPALSCWQNDVWSYRGSNSSVADLTSTALPGLELPPPLQNIFAYYLGGPVVPSLGLKLSTSALQSASTSFDNVFNASSSSLYNDLQRLVFASYIATVNTLTETTLYAAPNSVANEVLDANGQPSFGVDEFVIWSTDVATLSVKALIIIPVLTFVLWIIFIVVLLLPLKPIKALKELKTREASPGEAQVIDLKAHNKAEEEDEDQGKGKVATVIGTAASAAISVAGSLEGSEVDDAIKSV
jgi:hypothetical protein